MDDSSSDSEEEMMVFQEQSYYTELIRDPTYLRYLSPQDQTKDICIFAITRSWRCLAYVHNQTEDICYEAVSRDGIALCLVNDQTHRLCLTAVRQDGCALQFVKNKTKEICLEAVRQTVHALCFIEGCDEDILEIYLEAVKKDSRVIWFARDHLTDDLFQRVALELIKIDCWLLTCVKDQTIEMCLEAVKKDMAVLNYVKDLEMRKICKQIIKGTRFMKTKAARSEKD